MSRILKNVVQKMLFPLVCCVAGLPVWAETFSGEVEVYHVDHPTQSEYRYYLRVGDGAPVLLHIEDKQQVPTDLETGVRVRVEGDLENRSVGNGGKVIHVKSLKREVSLLKNSARKTSALMANQTRTVGIFLLSAPGLSAPTAAGMRGSMYDRADSVKKYFDAASYGQVNLNGDVNLDGNPDIMGPYAMSAETANACAVYDMVALAEAQAKAEGYDISKYQHRVLALPELPACKWSGLGSVGCGSYCYTWGKGTYPPLYAHEIGHNLGMHHAALDSNNDGGIDDEYGDPTDAMGNRSYGTSNAPHRVQLQWTSIKPDMVVDVNTSNIFNLVSLDTTPSASVTQPQILRLGKPNTNSSYYLALRTAPAPFGVPKEHLNRVSLHTWSGRNQTLFLRSLGAGQSFVDTANSLTVNVVAADANGATVQIEKGGATCTRAVPTLTLDRNSVWTAPGKNVTAVLSLRNNDSAGCANSTFAVQATSSAGISSTMSPSSLSLAPGASGAANLQVTVPGSMGAGSYTLGINSLADTNHSAVQVNFTVRVDTSAPSMPAQLVGVATNGAVALNWAAASDAESGIKTYRVLRNGGLLGNTTELKYTDSTASAGTSYRYQVVAENGVGLTIASNEVTVTPTAVAGDVCFYEHTNYAGASLCVPNGLGAVTAAWTKKISSIKLAEGLAVDVYEGANQTGRRLTYVRSMEDLTRVGFNDVITSWNVQARNQSGVASGVNYVITAQHSGLVADVKGESTYNGAAVHQWKWWGGQNQKWRLDMQADGYFRAMSLRSNKCLSPKGNAYAALTPLSQENCNDYPVRRWYFRAVGSSYELVNVRSGMCIEVANASLDNGGVLQENFCSGAAHQRWSLSLAP